MYVLRWIKTIIWRFNYNEFRSARFHVHSHRRRVFQLVAKYPISLCNTHVDILNLMRVFLLGWDGLKCDKYQCVWTLYLEPLVLVAGNVKSHCVIINLYMYSILYGVRLLRVLFRLQMFLSSWYIYYIRQRVYNLNYSCSIKISVYSKKKNYQFFKFIICTYRFVQVLDIGGLI